MLRKLKQSLGHRHPIRLAWHGAKALVAAVRYGFPARKLSVIGITGTDGKTTTVAMLHHILQDSSYKVGILSTAFVQIGEQRKWNETQKTSPSPFYILKFLRDCVKAGCTHAILEISSHGLVQKRLNFTWPTIAAITHLSPEHLDYHGTMEQYAKDKGILFQMLKGEGTKVLNADDQTFELYQSIPSEKTLLWSKAQRNEVSLSIPGEYNLDNALCALRCAEAIGVDLEKAKYALQSFKGLPGRLEQIDVGQPFSLFTDFTVTPNAYKETLKAGQEIAGDYNRLLVLAGSCGNRYEEKRPEIGSICAELADVLVLTSEETYTEPDEDIIADICTGIPDGSVELHQIIDRREALEFILKETKEGDVVILCGLGGIATRMTINGQIPWNEKEIVEGILRSF